MTARKTATIRRTRLAFENLECRLAPAILTVTGTGDTIATDGILTLREAITAANTNAASGDAAAGDPGLDEIRFNIAGAGVHTILPDIKLPDIQDAVIIDGYTQPGASPNTLAVGNNAVLLIEINGSDAGETSGLVITAPDTTIRGLVVNGFLKGTSSTQGRGIVAISAASTNLVITGNFVGVDPTGTFAVENEGNGIFVLGPVGARIGGTDPADRNVVSGNGQRGLFVNSPDVVIQGNYFGTNAAGTAAIPNFFEGVLVADNTNYQIGGTTAGASNVISGNLFAGLTLNAVSNSFVQGNKIGVGADGITPVPNGDAGLFISNQAGSNTNNLVGGPSASAANIIAFNLKNGIKVQDPLAVGNRFQANSIFENGELGINLTFSFADPGAPPTPNDPGDADTGANGLQNTPVLTSAPIIAGAARVNGSLNSIANETYRIEFFSVPVADATGGEGRTFIGATEVSTDASGNVTFQVIVNVPEGTIISSTATRLSTKDTSEFSNNVTASTLQGGTISGTVFDDTNSDGSRQPGEPGIGGVLVFLDGNGNGTPDNEPSALTAPNGTYSLTATLDGTFAVRVQPPPGAPVTTTLLPALLTTGATFPGTNLGVALPEPPPPPPAVERFAIAGGGTGVVLVFDAATRQLVQAFTPFPGYQGGLSVATGDLTGDGIPDTAVSTTTGAASLMIFDGATGAPIVFFQLPWTAGLNVATGDLDGDGTDDLILGTATSRSQVVAFRLSDRAVLANFLAFPAFATGVSVAAGDLNGDGRDELIVGAAQKVSLVAAIDLTTRSLVAGLQAFPGFNIGVNVAAGDTNGDGRDELFVGASSFLPVVRVFDGATLAPVRTFLALPGSGGVRVGAADLDGDGLADILTGAGFGAGAFGFAYRGTDLGLLAGLVGFGDPVSGAFVG